MLIEFSRYKRKDNQFTNLMKMKIGEPNQNVCQTACLQEKKRRNIAQWLVWPDMGQKVKPQIKLHVTFLFANSP